MYKYIPPPIEIGQATDVGRRRHENQDSMGYLQLDKFPFNGAHLLVVADGMGGANGGQEASSTAVEEIINYFQSDNLNPEAELAIREGIELAAKAVNQKIKDNPRLEGMGTTCVVCIIHNGYLFAGHIGDSRLYFLREGEMRRLTRDHSRVQFMLEAGIISEESAKNHPHQNFLARVLGSNQVPRVEVLAPPVKLLVGDRLLICSDGLYNEVSEEDIAEVMGSKPAQEASEKLIVMANDAGGNDNITIEILAYGPIPPKSVPETWFSFSSAFGSAIFHALVLVLFFLFGAWFFGYRTIPTSPMKAQSHKVSVSKQKKGTPNKVVAPRKVAPK